MINHFLYTAGDRMRLTELQKETPQMPSEEVVDSDSYTVACGERTTVHSAPGWRMRSNL